MHLNWPEPLPADRLIYDPGDVFQAGERNHHISNTAYPIAHEVTWGGYRVASRERHPEIVAAAFQGVNELCLYAHIPFCERRCSFCEYTVVSGADLQRTDAYMQALYRELEEYQRLLGHRRLAGFDIGGGTPSYVPAEDIAELLQRVARHWDLPASVAISIETTPRIAAEQPEKLAAYVRSGIRRISMGIQVIQPDLLKMLHRDGNGIEHHQRAVEHIRGAGFRDFNVDLMYGFAHQSLESWQATVEHALSLQPEAITLYRMRYKLTRISDQAPMVTLEQVRLQADWAKKRLREAGYWAPPGKNTFVLSGAQGPVHPTGTSDYISRRVVEGMPYLGLGLGAQTFTHHTISYNDGAVGKNLLPYLRAIEAGQLPLQDLYHLPRIHMMAKMVCVSFYFGAVHRASFLHKFGMAIERAYASAVEFAVRHGWMELNPEYLAITELGERHFSGLCALFHAPSVQRHLLERDPDAAEDMKLHRKRAIRVAVER